MAKTRPRNHNSRKTKNRKKDINGSATKSEPPEVLLAQASLLLQTGEPDNALRLANRALTQLQAAAPAASGPTSSAAALPALSLLGEISIELGDAVGARTHFEQAAALDEEGDAPEELGGGPEKFFWLAQLCEEGGRESVRWYSRGAECLRRQISALEARPGGQEQQLLLEEKRDKLAQALCGVAEVYMTDLSWDDAEAEAECERAVAEALLVAPDSAEVLQTVASVRISQGKREEARGYLRKSMDMWEALPPEHEDIPEFPTRISLTRLLMEAEMEEEAIAVLERLVQEDDHSVEAWYLGGWCLHLLANREAAATSKQDSITNGEDREALSKRSRAWLTDCLRLYEVLDYEDERLKEHALELVQELNGVLGPPEQTDGASEADDEEWEDEEDMDDVDHGGGDEAMAGS